jgi:hypothetical protein
MSFLGKTSPQLASAGIAFAILVLGACSGGGSVSGPGPAPLQQPATPTAETLSLPLPQAGVSNAALPGVSGFTETISFPANNASSGTTLALTVSSRAPGAMPALAPDMFVAQPFLYLTLNSNHTVTLRNYPSFTMTLPPTVKPNSLPVKIGYYDPVSGWKHIGDLKLVGSKATFTPSGSTNITLNANVNYYAITYTCGGPSPSPSPSSTSTTVPLAAATQLPIPAFGGFSGDWVAAPNNAPAGTTVTLTTYLGALAGAPSPVADTPHRMTLRPPVNTVLSVTSEYKVPGSKLAATSSSTIHFDKFPAVAFDLPAGFDTSGVTFKLETFDFTTGALLDTEIGATSGTSPIEVTFPGTDSPFNAITAHTYLWELVTQTTASPSPSPSPTTVACAWGVVTSPNGSTRNNVLNGTEANSSTDAWAAGWFTSLGLYHSLLEHWNGSAWSLATAPVPAGNNDQLIAMAGTSSSDVWAVGTYFNTTASQNETLIEHYNGTSWSVIPSPNVGTNFNYLRAVSAHAANDAWAVGQYVDPATGNTVPLTEHWNGTTWAVVTYASLAEPYNAVVGVADFGPSDVYAINDWSVNQNGTGFLNPQSGFYNGSSWTATTMPTMGTLGSPVNAMAAITDHDIWGIGDWDDSAGNFQTLAEHWNGTTWTIVPSPDNGGAEGSGDSSGILGATAVNTNNVWGVGAYFDGSANQTYTMQWNGTAWATVASPNVGTGNNVLNAAGKVPDTNDIWAVGYSTSGTLQKTLILGCVSTAKKDARAR